MAEATVNGQHRKRNSHACRYPGCRLPVSALQHCRRHLALMAQVYSPTLEDGYGPDLVRETDWFVYVMRSGADGPVKVGRAKDVRARRRAVQVTCPEKITVMAAFQMSPQQAVDVERESHHRLKLAGVHIRGEWFSIEPDAAIETVRSVAAVNRVPMAS